MAAIRGRECRVRVWTRLALREVRDSAGAPARAALSADWVGNNSMAAAKRFSKPIVDAIREAKILGIRAGTKPHRIIGIWAVVVEGRVFVRSYSLKPRSWWRTFHDEPRGVIEVNGKQFKSTAGVHAQRASEEISRSCVCRKVSDSGFARVC
jgi:Uncharacterized protein conserved in bacteria